MMENISYAIGSWVSGILKFFLLTMVSMNLISNVMSIEQTEMQESKMKVSNITECELPWWDGGLDDCGLVMQTFIDQNYKTRSLCGKRADVLGKGQKVISYCFFGNFEEYASGLPHILQTVRELYPGWVVRLYTEPQNYERKLAPLLLQYPNFYICDVANLPGSIPDIRGGDAKLWRAAAIGDELVDVILSRDIDAEILKREVSAVNEFLESGKSLHTMRDHHAQGARVMAGMFGIRQKPHNLKNLNSLRERLFAPTEGDAKRGDQTLLKEHIYRELKNDMITHDSYSCNRYTGTRPFPTQRENGKYIGNRRYKPQHRMRNDTVKIKCPIECRPADHPDWEYC